MPKNPICTFISNLNYIVRIEWRQFLFDLSKTQFTVKNKYRTRTLYAYAHWSDQSVFGFESMIHWNNLIEL